jgi:hypothetical protein
LSEKRPPKSIKSTLLRSCPVDLPLHVHAIRDAIKDLLAVFGEHRSQITIEIKGVGGSQVSSASNPGSAAPPFLSRTEEKRSGLILGSLFLPIRFMGLVCPPDLGAATHSARSHDIAWNSRLGPRHPRNTVASSLSAAGPRVLSSCSHSFRHRIFRRNLAARFPSQVAKETSLAQNFK